MIKSAMFVLVSMFGSLALAGPQNQVKTTYLCSESEGAGKWSVSVIEDTQAKLFWAGVKYEVSEYDCDDMTDGAKVGMKCHFTGGQVSIASPFKAFKACSTQGDVVICQGSNALYDESFISIQAGVLSFMLELGGEQSELITKMFHSVTASVYGKPRAVGISECQKTVTKN